MSTSQKITDRHALELRRKRAFKTSIDDLFLYCRALEEINLRLKDINRTFNKIAVITGCPKFWTNAIPKADILLDDEQLHFAKDSYDLVLHTMSLHWANDPVGQLIQCRLAMVPDGLLLAVFFGGETLTELRTSLLQAEIEICGGASPRVAPMTSMRDCGALLQRAGFALPVADRVEILASYTTLSKLAQDLRRMAETNVLAARRRVFSNRRFIISAEQMYKSLFSDRCGRLQATFELMFLTGWVPAANQQQPLRRGSAESKLADALKTVEHSLDR